MKNNMRIRQIREKDNQRLAEIVRSNLKANHLDLPGTVYFDQGLEHLSEYYLASTQRNYYVLTNDEDMMIGGIGFAEFDGFEKCAELQKLYLCDEAKGNGYGYDLIEYVCQEAKKAGYEQMYLETHTNLATAIHMYEKVGFQQIERPKDCVHSTMNRFYIKKL